MPRRDSTPTEREEYSRNPTVFGRILDGSLGATGVSETDSLLAFRDISPAAEHHFLIIPKKRYRHVGELRPSELGLLQDMVEYARQLASCQGIADFAAARADGSVSLGFHTWPFISIYHLHLHLIFPAPVTKSCIKRLKFPKGGAPWYVSPERAAVQFCDAPEGVNMLPAAVSP